MSKDLFDGRYRISSTRLQNWDYRWNGKYFITICTAQMQHFFGEIRDDQMYLSPQGELSKKYWYEITNHAKNVTLDTFEVMPNHVHGIIILKNKYDHSNTPDHRQREIKIEKLTDDDPMKDILKEIDDNYWEYLQTLHSQNLQGNENADLNDGFHHNPDSDENDFSNCNSDPNCEDDPNYNDDLHCRTDNACVVSTPKSPIPPPPPKKPPGSQRFQNQGKNSISSIIGSYKSAVSNHAHRQGYEMDWHPRFWDHIIRNDAELKRIRHYIKTNPQNWEKDKLRKEGGFGDGK